ncbi:hypothetical protein [Mesorhizobium sp.]|uniref:hypothetical protein n=1 Tax=Mesorhizobium sp. TaxID=1871066 RepID=UPI000FE69BF2|nr:hypothetical protein [Mesorhizobium sp.]RWE78802.1 MAG: hypothetical protein EOS42_04255 [Mesorhizobium sp.]
MTTKRGIIQFTPTIEKIRISIPGVSVDTAGPTQFLLHEAALYSQPYFSAFIACPFAGNTSLGTQDQTVQVTVPDVTATPVVLLSPVDSDSVISLPSQKGTGSGSSASGFNINNFSVSHWVVSSTRVDVRFFKNDTSRRSPNGAYLVLMRKPDLT